MGSLPCTPRTIAAAGDVAIKSCAGAWLLAKSTGQRPLPSAATAACSATSRSCLTASVHIGSECSGSLPCSSAATAAPGAAASSIHRPVTARILLVRVELLALAAATRLCPPRAAPVPHATIWQPSRCLYLTLVPMQGVRSTSSPPRVSLWWLLEPFARSYATPATGLPVWQAQLRQPHPTAPPPRQCTARTPAAPLVLQRHPPAPAAASGIPQSQHPAVLLPRISLLPLPHDNAPLGARPTSHAASLPCPGPKRHVPPLVAVADVSSCHPIPHKQADC